MKNYTKTRMVVKKNDVKTEKYEGAAIKLENKVWKKVAERLKIRLRPIW